MQINVSGTEKEGPFLVVAFDPDTRTYTLCFDDGKGATARGWSKFARDSLMHAGEVQLLIKLALHYLVQVRIMKFCVDQSSVCREGSRSPLES